MTAQDFLRGNTVMDVETETIKRLLEHALNEQVLAYATLGKDKIRVVDVRVNKKRTRWKISLETMLKVEALPKEEK